MSKSAQELTSKDISYTWTNPSKTEFVLHHDGTGIVRGSVGLGRKSFSIEVVGEGILTFRRMVDARKKAAVLWTAGHRVSFAGGKSIMISRHTSEEDDLSKAQESLRARSASTPESAFSAEEFPYLHKNGNHAKRLGQTTDLVRNINRVNSDELRDEFLKLIECAPHRSDRGKRYFVEGHNGIPSGGSGSNRSEEHLAMALWNLKRFWPRTDDSRFYLIDYQVPLQARQTDRGIGKVDLIGLTTKRRLIVIELKVKPNSPENRGETPASALFQGLRYAAIVQANQHAIAREIESRFQIRISDQPPLVQILAPSNWWQGWMQLSEKTRSAVGNWEMAFTRLSREIEGRVGVSIECASLEVGRLTLGGDGRRPLLARTPEISYFSPGVS